MAANRLKSSVVGLGFVAVVALGFVFLVKKAPPHQASTETKAPLIPGSAGSAPVGAAPVAGSVGAALRAGRDICEHAADRCACAATHGAELLNASFPERALQLVSRAPDSCNTPVFLGVRAEALAALERMDDATTAAAAALQGDAQNRYARRARAIVALQDHDYEAAVTALEALIAEDPRDADSLFYLALSERRRDHYNGAREGFLHTLRVNPEFIDARYNLVTLTATAGAAQEAEHDYEELEKITPVGDSRLIAARAALRGADKNAPAELPVLRASAPTPSVAPSR